MDNKLIKTSKEEINKELIKLGYKGEWVFGTLLLESILDDWKLEEYTDCKGNLVVKVLHLNKRIIENGKKRSKFRYHVQCYRNSLEEAIQTIRDHDRYLLEEKAI